MSDKDDDDKKPAAASDETSDVEMEGMDMDGDDATDDEDDVVANAVPESPTKESTLNDEEMHHLEEEEASN